MRCVVWCDLREMASAGTEAAPVPDPKPVLAVAAATAIAVTANNSSSAAAAASDSTAAAATATADDAAIADAAELAVDEGVSLPPTPEEIKGMDWTEGSISGAQYVGDD